MVAELDGGDVAMTKKKERGKKARFTEMKLEHQQTGVKAGLSDVGGREGEWLMRSRNFFKN